MFKLPLHQTAVSLFLVFWTHTAWAVDGVVELNQACVATGCLVDDDPGFPIEIKHKGSYRLTGNLLLPDADTTAVLVFSSHVTIDLNGLTIQGVTQCAGEPTICTNTGTGVGIDVDFASLPFGISVRNGHIVGMGAAGTNLLRSANIIDVHVTQCGIYGMFSGANSLVSGSSATFNGVDGIRANLNSIVANSRAAYNGGSGIYLVSDGVVSGNSAQSNANAGIKVGDGAVVHNNNAVYNLGAGFEGVGAAVFRGNTSVSNAIGISADTGGLVETNIARSNTEYGFLLGDTVYRGNSLTDNGTSPFAPAGTGINGGNNYCAGTGVVSSSCP